MLFLLSQYSHPAFHKTVTRFLEAIDSCIPTSEKLRLTDLTIEKRIPSSYKRCFKRFSSFNLRAAHQVLAEAAADHLAGRRVEPPPSKRRAGSVADTAGDSSNDALLDAATADAADAADAPGTAHCFRLEGGRVDAVGVQAFVDGAGLLDEARYGLVRDHDVRGRDGLLLVEPPDVQLVDGFYAWDLEVRGLFSRPQEDKPKQQGSTP